MRFHGKVGWWVAVSAALLAFAVRWSLSGGLAGLSNYHGYDDGVYFAAAVSLVHGNVPYRDFLLLHPPGVMLALVPSAALTHWISDAHALAVARVTVMLVGAANALLTCRIALRWGLRAAVVGGLASALALPAILTDGATNLEPWGTLALLGGVVVLLRAVERPGRPVQEWVGGAVLGLAVVTKLWEVVPVAILLCWFAYRRGLRAGIRAAAGAVVGAACVVAPFAVLAGPRMFRLVVLDQLGRAREPIELVERLRIVTGLRVIAATSSDTVIWILGIALLATLTVAAIAAWVTRRGRLWVVLLVAQSAVLATTASFYPNYPAYAVPAATLVLAAAASLVPVPVHRVVLRPTRWAPAATTLGVGAACALIIAAPSPAPRAPFPAASITSALPESGCITSDSPATLALLNVLSRNLDAGCPVPVDVSGYTYDVGGRDRDGQPVLRLQNAQWQKYIVDHLSSGAGAVVIRPVGNRFDPVSQCEVDRMTVEKFGRVRILQPRAPEVLDSPSCNAPTSTPTSAARAP